jgi:hypothetical protein
MAKGSKSSYSPKQKRQAAHIEESYEQRGVGEKEAKARAWRTVDKTTGGAKAKKKTSSARSRSKAKSPGKKAASRRK